MSWKSVGSWIKENAVAELGLVSSLLSGNIPGAIAAGASLVSGATGTDDPKEALNILKTNPESLVKLKELYYKDEDSIRKHIEEMTRLKLEDAQKEHRITQETIQKSDNSEDVVVRRTRPLQSWLSLIAAIAYVFYSDTPDIMILGGLLTLPFTYAGLRQAGKGIDSIASAVAIKKATK